MEKKEEEEEEEENCSILRSTRYSSTCLKILILSYKISIEDSFGAKVLRDDCIPNLLGRNTIIPYISSDRVWYDKG